MILIPTLSHMPFQLGETLYFCQSLGEREFHVAQTETAKSLGISPQVVPYQPWQLAIFRDGVITSLPVEGLVSDAPTRVFCNPVVVDDTISFVFGRNLYIADVSENVLRPIKVKERLFTGFVGGNKTVYSLHCEGSTGDFVIQNSQGTFTHSSGFDSIVRIVPSGPNSLIITGNKGPRIYSILWHNPESIYTIQANGKDVYKCCLDGSDVIHTVKGSGIDNRQIHRDPVELIHE